MREAAWERPVPEERLLPGELAHRVNNDFGAMIVRSPILRYGFAVVSVVAATAIALAIQEYQFRDVELPLLVLVIGLVNWYAGTGPTVVAVLLATAVFSYLFVEPLYSFYVSARDLPYFL